MEAPEGHRRASKVADPKGVRVRRKTERSGDLAVRFARDLAARYGCAVDVALPLIGRGDKRNWHAHLPDHGPDRRRADREMRNRASDAKRLSLGLAAARIEVASVRVARVRAGRGRRELFAK